jgi:hypothetical protein
MSDSTDTMAADLEPLMLELGKAVYICQAFESSLCFLHAQMTHEETGGEEGAFTASWDFHSAKTLGQTLNALRKRIEIPAELDDYLEEGLKCRNRIVHGFLTKNMARLMEPKGRLEVHRELEELKLEVKHRDIIVNKLLDALFAKTGSQTRTSSAKPGKFIRPRTTRLLANRTEVTPNLSIWTSPTTSTWLSGR